MWMRCCSWGHAGRRGVGAHRARHHSVCAHPPKRQRGIDLARPSGGGRAPDRGTVMAGAATGTRKPLLEREGELGRLRDLVAATAEGRGASVVLEGPAGIGKTSLLDA